MFCEGVEILSVSDGEKAACVADWEEWEESPSASRDAEVEEDMCVSQGVSAECHAYVSGIMV